MNIQIGHFSMESLYVGIEDKSVNLIILLPDTVIELQTNVGHTLEKIKEELLKEIRSLLFDLNLIREFESYIFSGINHEAEVEEYYDETQIFINLNLIGNILKFIPKKSNVEESQFASMVKHCVSYSLDDIIMNLNDSIKNEILYARKQYFNIASDCFNEITMNDRAALKFLYSSSFIRNLGMAVSKILQAFESLEIVSFINTPTSTIKKITRLPKDSTVHSTIVKLLMNFKDYYNYDKSDLETWARAEAPNYVLKVSSLNDYMIHLEVRLVLYDYIQMCLYKNENPILSLYPISKLTINRPTIINPPYFYEQSQFPTNSSAVSDNKFNFYIITASNVIKDRSKIYVKAGLFCGSSIQLCSSQQTNMIPPNSPNWNQSLTFDIEICNIPRNTRLCVTLMQNLDRRQEVLGTTTLNLFDFTGKFIEGNLMLRLVPINPEINSSHFAPNFVTRLPYNTTNTLVINVKFPVLTHNYYSEFEFRNNMFSNKSNLDDIIRQRIKAIIEKDILSEIAEQDRDFLRSNMFACLSIADSLPRLAKSIRWNKAEEVKKFYTALELWGNIRIETAFQLLGRSFYDNRLRKFAIRCIESEFSESKSDLNLYLLQLIQALKYESYIHNDLGKFLLKLALTNRNIGQKFFWYLRSEVHQNELKIYFGTLLEAFLYGFININDIIYPQVKALQQLVKITKCMDEETDNLQLERFHRCIEDQDIRRELENIPSLINPNEIVGEIILENCRVMKSKKRPLMLDWKNPDEYCDAKEVEVTKLSYIFKHGDDLRQDILTLQLLSLFDWIWKRKFQDMKLMPYGCLATGHEMGIIEVVKNSKTVMRIQKTTDIASAMQINPSSIYNYLKTLHTDPESMQRAIDNFTVSCAGYSVATFILGIRDRHNDNIMVHKDGFIFHIDFGHILNNTKKKFGFNRERVPFVLPDHFLYVIGNRNIEKRNNPLFEEFGILCGKAYLEIRKHTAMILTLFTLMIDSGLPELSGFSDLDYLKKTLQVNKSEKEALDYFNDQFSRAYEGGWSTKLDWFFHWQRN